MMTNPIPDTSRDMAMTEGPAPKDPARIKSRRRALVAAVIAAPVALGAAGLTLAQTNTRIVPLATSQVAQLGPSAAVSVKGQVAEIFGNKFILQDGTGRALVELGRRGEGGQLVKAGEDVTVQGRFENGFLHAGALVHRDGSVETLGPDGGPRDDARVDPRRNPPMGLLDWAKSKVGLLPAPDMPAITAALQSAGFSEIRVIGSGPKHVDVAAKDASGRDHQLHVGLDGQIKRDRPIG